MSSKVSRPSRIVVALIEIVKVGYSRGREKGLIDFFGFEEGVDLVRSGYYWWL